jgi:hypothetical protein
MAQAVSRRPHNAEVRVRGRVVHMGFVVDKVALERVSHRVLRFSPNNIISPELHTHFIWGMNTRPVGGRSS